MIYNKDFVWIHFPKAAGSKIELVFRNHFSGDLSIHQDIVGIKSDPSISWHDSIGDRQKRDPSFTLSDRCLIVCVRRLPAWLKSRFLYEIKRSPKLNHDPNLLILGKFLERTGQINHADNYISKYIPAYLIENHANISYLKVEDFANDFVKIFSRYIDISKISKRDLEQKVNASHGSTKYNVDQIISDNLAVIYGACPLWSELEKSVYGGIVT
jgi:hypothetical protein